MKQPLILAGLLMLAPTPLLAEPNATERPEVLSRLTACRAITDDRARLACFDTQVAALAAAEASREIAVVDRQQLRRTRRSLFGLNLPNLGIFGGDGDHDQNQEGITEINSTIRSTSSGADGRWQFALQDGAVWVQTDGRQPSGIHAGNPVRIRRGPLGSYIANIGERPGIRVMRQR